MEDFNAFCEKYLYLIEVHLNKVRLTKDERDDFRQELVLWLYEIMLKIDEHKPMNEGAYVNRSIFNQTAFLLNQKNKFTKRYCSLDENIDNEEEMTFIDLVADDKPCHGKQVEYNESIEIIKKVLDEREFIILQLCKFEELSEAECAKIIGISQQAISKKLKKIHAKIKVALENQNVAVGCR